MKFSHFRR